MSTTTPCTVTNPDAGSPPPLPDNLPAAGIQLFPGWLPAAALALYHNEFVYQNLSITTIREPLAGALRHEIKAAHRRHTHSGGTCRMRTAATRMIRRGEAAITSPLRDMPEATDCRGTLAGAGAAYAASRPSGQPPHRPEHLRLGGSPALIIPVRRPSQHIPIRQTSFRLDVKRQYTLRKTTVRASGGLQDAHAFNPVIPGMMARIRPNHRYGQGGAPGTYERAWDMVYMSAPVRRPFS